jgi:hypothetical protein
MLSQELGENWVVWTPARLPSPVPLPFPCILQLTLWLKGYYFSASSFNRNARGQINYIDIKVKCCHLKKIDL